MSEQEWPAFRPEFEGHIGQIADHEEFQPNDLGNSRRMVRLYGQVFRWVELGGEDGSIWRVWNGTRWSLSKGAVIKEAVADMIDWVEQKEIWRYQPDGVPTFPDDWNVISVGSGKPFKALMGKYGALNQAPEQTFAWAGESPERGKFLGERLAAEQDAKEHQQMTGWMEKCKSDAGMNAAVSQLKARGEITAHADDFDQVRNKFVFKNGELDTRTGTFSPGHSPEDLNTRVCAHLYNPSAKARRWRNYLFEQQPDKETRRYLQKLAGYMISGHADQKLIAFMYSKLGDTGKSVFVRVLEDVMGRLYAVSLAAGTLSKRRFDDGGRDPDREQIRGKRGVFAHELSPNEPLDEAFVKKLSGGDGISTRGNYSREGNTRWQPECLVMVATNHLSRINAEDEAVWNRIQVVPWKVQVPKFIKDERGVDIKNPKRDEELAEKIIAEEAEGVLVWMVQGLKMYLDEGLTPPPEVVEASMSYRSQTDLVSKWLADWAEDGRLLMGDGYFCTQTELHHGIKAWCKSEKVPTANWPKLSELKARLLELGYEFGKVGTTSHRLRGAKAFKGIEIHDEVLLKLILTKKESN